MTHLSEHLGTAVDDLACRPITFDEGTRSWIVTRYADAKTVLTGDGWSSDPIDATETRALLAELGLDDAPIARTMLGMNPPDHTRVRDSVRDVFTPRYVTQLTAGVTDIADSIIASPTSGVPLDFMSEIARPLPLEIIAAWLDLDAETVGMLWEESADLVSILDTAVSPDADMRAAISSFAALTTHLLPTAAARRAAPGDDLLSLLATDDRLDLDEVVVNALLLAVAGHETTAKLLGNAVIRLLDDADGDRPIDRVDVGEPTVIDELLRLDSPVRLVMRAATRPHEVGGATIAAGDRVIVLLAAANRDPDVYTDPDRLIPDRDGPPALMFGYGRHRCLGAALSRLEVGIALRRIAARTPRLAGQATWQAGSVLRGPDRVPVRFGSDAPREDPA